MNHMRMLRKDILEFSTCGPEFIFKSFCQYISVNQKLVSPLKRLTILDAKQPTYFNASFQMLKIVPTSVMFNKVPQNASGFDIFGYRNTTEAFNQSDLQRAKPWDHSRETSSVHANSLRTFTFYGQFTQEFSLSLKAIKILECFLPLTNP